MCDAGRIKHHLKHNLPRPECSVIFVGYQADGTLGRRLTEGEKRVRIHGEDVDVRANIINLEGFSAHIDQPGILEWFSLIENKPEKVILVHGDEDQMTGLKGLLCERFHADILMPEWLDSILIEHSADTKQNVLLNNASFKREEIFKEHKDFMKIYRTIQQNLDELLDIKKGNVEDLMDDLTIIEKISRKFLK